MNPRYSTGNAGGARKEAPLANVPAEKMVIGAILRSPHQFWTVADTLKPDQFTVPVHQQIFAVMQDVLLGNRVLSLPVLQSRLPEESDDGESMAAVLAALAHNADGQSATDFADQVAETASRRLAIQIGDRLAREARAGSKLALEIAGEAEAALLEVMQVTSPKRPKRISEISEQVVLAGYRASKGETLPGFTTGLPSLDEILGLILGGDAGFILGAQGHGKSALAAQIGAHVSQSRPVLMIQMEMSDDQIAAREIAALSGISVRGIQEGAFDRFEYDLIQEARDKLKQSEFWVIDAPEMTVRQIGHQCMAMQRTVGLGMVLIDQLDKIKGEGRYKDRFERSAEITRDIKILAKKLGVPFLTMAQRTRGSQRRDDSTPDVLDADAPSIERDADWVLAVWREEDTLRRNKPPESAGGEAMEKWEHAMKRARTTAKVICLKRRRGAAFEQCTLNWHGATTRFSELTG